MSEGWDSNAAPAAKSQRSRWPLVAVLLGGGCFLGIVALGVTLVFLLPRLQETLDGAYLQRVRAELERIAVALEEYRDDHARWPDELAVLATPDDTGQRALSTSDLDDPWFAAYGFDAEGEFYRLWSFGETGVPGGRGHFVRTVAGEVAVCVREETGGTVFVVEGCEATTVQDLARLMRNAVRDRAGVESARVWVVPGPGVGDEALVTVNAAAEQAGLEH